MKSQEKRQENVKYLRLLELFFLNFIILRGVGIHYVIHADDFTICNSILHTRSCVINVDRCNLFV